MFVTHSPLFQIRRIKAAEGAGEGAVQQGEVSSSKPTLLPSQRLGPLLLEVRTTGRLTTLGVVISGLLRVRRGRFFMGFGHMGAIWGVFAISGADC